MGGLARAQPIVEGERGKPGPAAPPPKLQPAPATDATFEPFQERLIRDITISGLTRVDRTLIANQVRSRVGQPLNAETVRGDVQRLNRLGRFKSIDAAITPFDDGSVLLAYQFVETPVVQDVQAVGNRQLSDAELAGVISILKNTPIDEFQLGSARSQIEKLYRDKGYYQASVTVDQSELEKNNIILFRINEGERVKVTDVRFEGNQNISARQLRVPIKTTENGLFETGPVDPEQLDRDVQTIAEYYRDRGYLDVRTDRRITFAPNGREAIVTFVVEEGPVYTLKGLRAELVDGGGGRSSGKPTVVISPEQLAGLMEIKAGDVFSVNKVQRSIDRIRNSYARMGYVDAIVNRAELRDPARPEVELLLLVREGEPFKAGLITVKGNELTKTSVILRELDIAPERPLDTSVTRRGPRLINRVEEKLEETRLFEPNSPKVTIQPEDPANPGFRDMLIEVKETNTGSFGFGAGVTSDLGLIGQVSLTQRNFDLYDTPDSFDELITGRAFRGGGQTFNITLAPGTETQAYSIGISDPALFDTDYSGAAQAFYRQRQYDQYDEDRLGARFSVGRRFGERWVGTLTLRAEDVRIGALSPERPVDVFDVQGHNAVTGVGVSFVRNTANSRFRPSKGTRLELGVERAGALGGDFDFTRLNISHVLFLPVYEDFLGYKTVLSFKTNAEYIPEGPSKTPTFERFYLGGTTFRGFQYRTISPKGIRNDTGVVGDDSVGGTWQFFAGAELVQPVYKDIVSAAFFIDSGTVTNRVGFSDYRVSAGVGIRLAIDALGPVPLAFDFGFPVLKQDGDRSRFFSFSIDLPF